MAMARMMGVHGPTFYCQLVPMIYDQPTPHTHTHTHTERHTHRERQRLVALYDTGKLYWEV